MNIEKVKSNVCLIKACSRSTHKESKYCIFHAKPEEKNEKKFKQALKKYVNKVKKEDDDYDFEKFIFVGNINFKKDFNVTLFKKANFNSAIFKGISNFEGIVFEENSFFRNAIFENAAFLSTTFKGNANFRSAIFHYANFKNSTFRSNANFRNVTFGTVYFRSTKFNKFVSFRSTTFNKYANFKNAIFRGIVTFLYATLVPGKKLNIKAEGTGIIVFEQTNLENVFLDLNLDKGVLIDFTNTLLRNTNFTKSQIENHILQEEKKEFSQAREVYLLLKNNFHSIGRYDDDCWAFEKEKEMERSLYSYGSFIKKIRKDKNISKNKKYKKAYTGVGFFLKWLFTKNFLLWIIYGFLAFLFGYGERPLRVIRFAIIIIIVSAFFYMYFGISTYPENIKLNLDMSNNILTEPQEITLNTKLSGIIIKDFYNCLYFSTVTFTTLGYGDLRPLEGWCRIFAGTEAFIGAFIMALFVYTFARRTGGR